MRQEPVPWAYRVFFRQVGIDPDERRTPIEQIVLDRLQPGGFKSRNLLDDALTIATFETGVPIVGFDADHVEGGLGLRLSREGELLGSARPAARRAARSRSPTASARWRCCSRDMDPARGVTPDTTRMLLAAVQVEGVPGICVEEALWTHGRDPRPGA